MRTSVACIPGLLLMLCCSFGSAEAQSVSEDSASQRILPLPEDKLSDVQTQMQLLQKLRSLVAAADDTAKSDLPTSTDVPRIDDKQLEQLQQALKKLQEQLPPGIKPPDLDSIPKEQLDEAMSNPDVQQQLKKMLEQFSKDGLLPKNDGDAGNSPLPPIPRPPGQPPAQPRMPQSGQSSPPSHPGEQSWESLKDAMKKLAEIAQGEKKIPSHNDETSPEIDTARDHKDASTRTVPQPGSNNEPQPRDDQPRDDQPRDDQPRDDQARDDQARDDQARDDQARDDQPRDNQPRDDRNDVERVEGESPEDEAGNRETPQPSLQAFQDLLKRYKDSQRNLQQPDDGTSGPEPDDTRLPEVRPGMPSPRTGNEGSASTPNPSRRVIRRPDRAKPLETPMNSGPRRSEQGEVFPPADIPSDVDPPSPVGNSGSLNQRSEQQSQNSSGSGSSEKTMPSVTEFLKEQFRNGFPAPGTSEDAANSKSSGSNNRPGSSPPVDSGRRDSAQPGTPDAAARPEQAGVDIRRELQKRGVRGTIEKIIEKAKVESKAQRKAKQQAEEDAIAGQTGPEAGQPGTEAGQPGSTGRRDVQTKSSGDNGLQNSLTDLLEGMGDKVEDIIKDAKFKEQTAESRQPRNSTWQQSPTDSDSRMNKWNDAASNFLSDLSKAPSGPAASRSSSGGRGSDSAAAPLAIGSLFLVGLGLLGILAVVAFFMRRPLLKLVSDATGVGGSPRVLQPSEIRSREDVISAFHELALNPKRLVESWWTHRAAATKLAAESPQQGNAVRTLAEIYEQARYLPDDVELPADRIQSARIALAECR